MARRPSPPVRPDWRRDHMWVGKGVPFWLAALAIAALAWAAVNWLG